MQEGVPLGEVGAGAGGLPLFGGITQSLVNQRARDQARLQLAARVIGYLERKRAFETIQNSVDQARLTQAALLPQEPPQVSGAVLARRYVPAEHLSGDFYDFFALRDGRLVFGVACARLGRGTPPHRDAVHR